MSVKHTPGPWQMDTAGRNIFMVFPENDPEGCTVVASNIRLEADALLIKAAPDLLEALQAIRMRLATGSSYRMGTMIDEIAQAAIAKATGKE